MDINVAVAKALKSANKAYQTASEKIPARDPVIGHRSVQLSPKCGGFGKVTLEIDNESYGSLLAYCKRSDQCNITDVKRDSVSLTLTFPKPSNEGAESCVKPQISGYKRFVSTYNKKIPDDEPLLSGDLKGNVEMLKWGKDGRITTDSKRINIFLK